MNENPTPNSPSPSRRLKWQQVLGITSIVVAGVGVGVGYGWWWLEENLTPIIDQELSKILERPVKVGELEGLSFGGLRLGATEIPPTPTDVDSVSLEAVEVSFNPWSLFNRRLDLNVELIKPRVYLQQDTQGVWLNTNFKSPPPTEEGGIEINLNSIQIKQADVTLVGVNGQKQLNKPVQLTLNSGKVNFLNDYSLIELQLMGSLTKGGKFDIDATISPPKEQVKLSVLGQQISLPEISRLTTLPVEISQGSVNSQLQLEILQQRLISITGTANLQQVTAKLPQLPLPFSNTNGKILFDGNQIKVDSLNTMLGVIPASAIGNIDISTQKLDITANTQPVVVKEVLNSLKISPLGIPLQGQVKANVEITGNLQQPLINLSASNHQPWIIDKITIDRVQAQAQILGEELKIKEVKVSPALGGIITGKGGGKLTEEVNIDIEAQEIPIKAIASSYKFPSQLPITTSNATGSIKIPITKPQQISVNADVTIPISTGEIKAGNITYKNNNLEGDIRIVNVPLSVIPQIPSHLQEGTVQGQFQIAANTNKLQDLKSINVVGFTTVNTPQGRIIADTITLAKGIAKASVKAEQLNLTKLIPAIPPSLQQMARGKATVSANLTDIENIEVKGNGSLTLSQGTFTATNLELQGDKWQVDVITDRLNLTAILPQANALGLISGNLSLRGDIYNQIGTNIQGRGVLRVGQGTITANNLQLQGDKWQGVIVGKDIHLGKLLPQVPSLGKVDWHMSVGGSLANLNLAGISGYGSAQVDIGAGQVSANNFRMAEGNFITNVIPERINIATFSSALRGEVKGDLILRGSLDDLTPKGIDIEGDLAFNKGIFILNSPINTTISWDGKRLDISRATGKDISVDGYVDLDSDKLLQGKVQEAIEQFNMNLLANNLQLEGISELFVDWKVPTSGSLNVQASLKGTPQQPQVDAKILLQNLTVAGWQADKTLKGTLQSFPTEPLNLEVVGNTTKLQLALDSTYRPTNLLLQIKDALITGTRKEENFFVEAKSVPIDFVKSIPYLPPQIASQPLAGNLTSNATINMNNFASDINIQIDFPTIGSLRAEKLTATLAYRDGNLQLTQGVIDKKQGKYLLTADIALSDNPRIHGNAKVVEGDIQDVLETFRIFELNDLAKFGQQKYGDAADIYPEVVELSEGLPDASITDQLRRLSEVDALLRQNRLQRRETSPLPPLRLLDGNFNAEMDFDASLKTGIQAQFNFLGEKWKWGRYQVDEVKIEGKLQNQTLSLNPVSITSGDSVISFVGEIDRESQFGQLSLQKIPLSSVERFVQIPPAITINGLINTSIFINGSHSNPKAKGILSITDVSVNQTAIQSTEGSFSYENSRLIFLGSSIFKADTTPVSVQATIPYQLPFSTFKPDSDLLNININLQDDGFGLLDILTQNNLQWRGGKGTLNLDIQGRLTSKGIQNLTALGVVTLQDTTIASQLLPEDSIKNLNGKILASFDQITVESITGKLGDGNINIAGVIPLVDKAPVDNPLTVNLDEVALNLKGLYSGSVAGNILIKNSVLEPKITGNLDLFDGQVLLSETAIEVSEETEPQGFILELDGLTIDLKRNIEIVKPPILNFLADGQLIINGTLDNPRPKGKIFLRQGEVNLFTTQFRLTGGQENTAEFFPYRGLDPYLNVNLSARAIETTRGPILTDPTSTEIRSDSFNDIGRLQTIIVQAKAEGYASRLNQSISLSSVPPRSQTEIVTLLGGGFINTLGGGDPSLGLASVASSALLSTFQRGVSNALGLSEFRIFPTPVLDEDKRSSSFGIAGEAALDVGDAFSVSVLKILNLDIPTQYGVRYRLDANTVMRGSSNFDDDSRFVIEYNTRF